MVVWIFTRNSAQNVSPYNGHVTLVLGYIKTVQSTRAGKPFTDMPPLREKFEGQPSLPLTLNLWNSREGFIFGKYIDTPQQTASWNSTILTESPGIFVKRNSLSYSTGRSRFKQGICSWKMLHKSNTKFPFQTVHFLGDRRLMTSSYLHRAWQNH